MKNFKPGKQIVSFDELFSYKSVFVTRWNRAHPTAFFLSWQYRELKKFLDRGYFCVAIRKEKDEIIF